MSMIPKRKRGPVPKIETPAYRVALLAVLEKRFSIREMAQALNRSERAIMADAAVLEAEQGVAA